MSSDTARPDASIRHGLWQRLLGQFGRRKSGSLTDSLKGVLENHEVQNPQEDLRAEARSMMLNLIDFGDLRVDDVMVPRSEIIAVPETICMRDLFERFINANHSRLPVYRDTLDNVVGMIHIKDFVRWLSLKGGLPVRKKTPAKISGIAVSAADLSMSVRQSALAREVLYVPPSMPAADLLVRMQAGHIHLAIVVDEYGGTDGLVSIEDLVEEIVGDIADEHDEDDNYIAAQADGTLEADARIDLEDLEKQTGVALGHGDEEESDTLGGLIFSMLGRVPKRGEKVAHSSGTVFTILDADPRRLKRVNIRLPQEVPGNMPDSEADTDHTG